MPQLEAPRIPPPTMPTRLRLPVSLNSLHPANMLHRKLAASHGTASKNHHVVHGWRCFPYDLSIWRAINFKVTWNYFRLLNWKQRTHYKRTRLTTNRNVQIQNGSVKQSSDSVPIHIENDASLRSRVSDLDLTRIYLTYHAI